MRTGECGSETTAIIIMVLVLCCVSSALSANLLTPGNSPSGSQVIEAHRPGGAGPESIHRDFLAANSPDEPWNADQLISPEMLARMIQEKQNPVIIQVGIAALFRTGRIPGSVFAGPCKDQAGLDKLKEMTANIAPAADLVIYCGCCPFKVCPNIRPAFVALQKMGFKNVKVLNLEENFGRDWAGKGYPVEKSEKGRS